MALGVTLAYAESVCRLSNVNAATGETWLNLTMYTNERKFLPAHGVAYRRSR